MAPDPISAFVWSPCCPTLDFVFAFWIMITFNTLLTFAIRNLCLIKFERYTLDLHTTHFCNKRFFFSDKIENIKYDEHKQFYIIRGTDSWLRKSNTKFKATVFANK
jgi:hypothetical protein